MSIVQGQCLSFKRELWTATHDFTPGTGDVFKLALYDSTASLSPDTTAYTTTGEIAGTGYSAGGATLTAVAPTTVGQTVVVTFSNLSWAGATFSARGGLIYNSSKSNKAVCVLNFGSDRSVAAGTFTVKFPPADASNAILRYT